MEHGTNPYDVVTYPAQVYRDTHPGRLAVMARLHGLVPAPVEHCRVLEIGCNAGANVIPMAYALPGSDFIGFDLASLPIAAGQRRIADLGLTNIRLFQADILEAEHHPELQGDFDYIIAHGVYSWTPEPVRDRLLAFCKQHLSAQGVAFISYNTLPGSHVRLITREILTFERSSSDTGQSTEDLAKGTELLQYVVQSRPPGDGFRVLLERELHSIERRGAQAVFHDEAATFFTPFYFRDFAAHAHSHDLGYLSEATLPGPVDPGYQQPVLKHLRAVSGGDAIAMEHLLDVLRMRMYRETLLCHGGVARSSDLQPDALRHLYFSSRATASAGEVPGSTTYTSHDGIRIQSDHPATVQVLDYLISLYPQSADYGQLAEAAAQSQPCEPSELARLILQLYISHLVELDSWQPPLASKPEERPLASLSSRVDLRSGTKVASLLHSTVDLVDPISRGLLALLDGTRDHAALVRELSAQMPEVEPTVFAEGIPQALHFFASNGLLKRRP